MAPSSPMTPSFPPAKGSFAVAWRSALKTAWVVITPRRTARVCSHSSASIAFGWSRVYFMVP